MAEHRTTVCGIGAEISDDLSSESFLVTFGERCVSEEAAANARPWLNLHARRGNRVEGALYSLARSAATPQPVASLGPLLQRATLESVA